SGPRHNRLRLTQQDWSRGRSSMKQVVSRIRFFFAPSTHSEKNQPDESALGEADYPAVAYAYEFVLPSYDWAVRRFEGSETRLHNLQTYSATIAFGAPVAAKAISATPNFDSMLFVAGVACFVLVVTVATFARLMWGTLT